jgi:hypothetical protein
MKKPHTLRALILGVALASSSAGCSLFGGGSSSGPSVSAVEPQEGNAGTTVAVTLENFSDKRDILLFGGVPVRTEDPVAPPAGSVPTLPPALALLSQGPANYGFNYYIT